MLRKVSFEFCLLIISVKTTDIYRYSSCEGDWISDTLLFYLDSRLKIVEYLSNFFRSVIVLSPGDLVQCVYLCLNKLAPAYAGVELGIGESLLMKTIAQATGKPEDCRGIYLKIAKYICIFWIVSWIWLNPSRWN